MSIEQLLFFLLLVAIPLLERLIRAMRARTGGSSGERDPAAAGRIGSRPRPPLSVPDAGGTASDERRTELTLPASPLPPALPQAGHSDRPMRPGTALGRIVAGGDLRRAIVLIAILGPCRALEPKDASQLG